MIYSESAVISSYTQFASVLCISFFLAYLIAPRLSMLFYETGMVKPNYRHEQIPLGMGIIFLFTAMLIIIPARLFDLAPKDFGFYLLVISVIGFAGFIDDALGTHDTSGFSGHFTHFLKGNLTTGMVKVFAGGMMALLTGCLAASNTNATGNDYWTQVFVNTILMALATNTINLLDLRPGRAGKSFILFSALLVIPYGQQDQIIYLATITGSVLAFLNMDLRGQAMMGDTGSNVLGATLGYVALYVLPFSVKVGIAAVLIALHVFTENHSLTCTIKNNRFLNYLDEIGRR